MSAPLRGIGAREPDDYELKFGWLLIGGGAVQRVDHGEPDVDDPETVYSELDKLMDAAERAAEDAT